MISLKL